MTQDTMILIACLVASIACVLTACLDAVGHDRAFGTDTTIKPRGKNNGEA